MLQARLALAFVAHADFTLIDANKAVRYGAHISAASL